MEAAREMAQQWAEQAENKYDMDCTYEKGALQDTLCFARAGIKGTLDVLPGALDFHAQLGFLVSAFKERIQTELEQQLDAMLASSDAPRNTKASLAAGSAGVKALPKAAQSSAVATTATTATTATSKKAAVPTTVSAEPNGARSHAAEAAAEPVSSARLRRSATGKEPPTKTQ